MKKLSGKLLLGLALTSAPIAQAEITSSIELTSDYRFRGISQSADNPALQGSLDYSHDSGFFAGVWGSNVDFYAAGDPLDNDESLELDLYAGYYGEAGDNLGYDLTLYRYLYPGAVEDVDYTELSLGIDLGGVRLAYWYADDYFNSGDDYSYVEANYSIELPAALTLGLHAGYSFGGFFDDPDAVWLDEYADYSLTLSRSLGAVDVSLAYLDTDIDAPFAIDDDHLANQDTWLLSLSRQF